MSFVGTIAAVTLCLMVLILLAVECPAVAITLPLDARHLVDESIT
jgi:hypothetical protein